MAVLFGMPWSDQILSALRDCASDSRRALTLQHAPTQLEVIGVTMPEVNAITREAATAWRQLPVDARWSCLRALLASGVLEAHLVAWDVLAKDRKALAALTPSAARELMSGLDNWVTVDTLGPRVLGVAWRHGALSDDFVRGLQTSENPFERRLALTMTIALNLKSRGGRGDARRTLEVVERALDDRHDLVVKAVSWALRQLVDWDRDAVLHFLAQHDQHVAARVRREVQRKLETGKKN